MMNALGAIDTKGNIVLEQFQDGTALLFQPGNAQPFCVATDYDRATASWSYGKYFSDLGCAYEAADPEIIEDASVRWVKEDIREKLKAQDIAPTEFNVQSVIMGDSRLWERPLDRDFRDNMIASGNDDLDARVTILKENGNFKNGRRIFPRKSEMPSRHLVMQMVSRISIISLFSAICAASPYSSPMMESFYSRMPTSITSRSAPTTSIRNSPVTARLSKVRKCRNR